MSDYFYFRVRAEDDEIFAKETVFLPDEVEDYMDGLESYHLIDIFSNREIFFPYALINGKMFHSQILANIVTNENEPLTLDFPREQQVQIILDNLNARQIIKNYNEMIWIDDICRTLRYAISDNYHKSVYDYKYISNRLNLIINLYNIIENRMRLQLYCIFNRGMYSQFYRKDESFLEPNPIMEMADNQYKFNDAFQIFSFTPQGCEINAIHFDFEKVKQNFERGCKNGFFSTDTKRIQVENMLSSDRELKYIVSVKFSNFKIHAIDCNESCLMKMLLMYLTLIDNNLYDNYDFKYEFQSRNDEMNLLYVRNKYKRVYGKETSKILSLLDDVEDELKSYN